MPYFTKDESAMTEKTIWLFAGCLIATVGFAYVGNKILKRYSMDSLLIFMTGVAIIAAGLAFGVNTKMGKKWIDSL